jgi:hypothetical protein
VQLQYRKAFILDLLAKGYSQIEISKTLGFHTSIISKDIAKIRRESRERMQDHIDNELPLIFERTATGLNLVLRKSWQIHDQTKNDRDKMAALSLAMDAYKLQLELASNSNVLDTCIRFVQVQKQKLDQQKEVTTR